MKKMIGLWGILFVVYTVQAQNNADSLVAVLNNKNLTTAEQLEICDQLCNIYSENDVDKCILYAKKGLALAEKEKNKVKISRFYGELGVDYYTKSSYDTALIYQEKALALAIEAKDKDQEASVYTDIGNLYRRQSKYEKAMESYMKAMAISDSLGDKNDYAIALINISGIHSAMNNNERALYFLKQAEDISKQLNRKYLQMSVYYRLGKVCADEGKYDEAVEYALKSNDISRTYGDKKFEIASLNLLAATHANLKDYGKSMEYAGECVQLAEKYNDKRLLMGVLNELSGIYLKQSQYRECATLSLKSWRMDSTDLVYATDASRNLSLANIYLGNKDKAEYFLDQFNNLMIQHTNKNVHDALIEMEVKYETEKKETRITTLEKEKSFYIWMSVAGGIVLLLAFGTLSYRHRMNVQKRKIAEQQRELAEQKIKQLEQESQLIATQSVLEGESAERSRLARDLHDGLGGLLTVVRLNLRGLKSYSAMDDPDAERFDKALEMLDESIGELRRVAHHMMPESLIRFGLRVSLEDFCRAIPGAHFQYYGGELRLDSRLEALIYRCTYELVNNAIKHADATTINVQLMIDNGLVSLSVYDDGNGFDTATAGAGTGLENIRTRVSVYNGKMNIYSSPGKGTEINIEIENSHID